MLVEKYKQRQRMLAYLRKIDPHMYIWLSKEYEIPENMREMKITSFAPKIVHKRSMPFKRRYVENNPI